MQILTDVMRIHIFSTDRSKCERICGIGAVAILILAFAATPFVMSNAFGWKIGSLPEKWSNIYYGSLVPGSAYPKPSTSALGWIFASVYKVSDKQFAVKGEYSVQKSCSGNYRITIFYYTSFNVKKVSYDYNGCQKTFNTGSAYLTPKEISLGKTINVLIEDKYNKRIFGLISWTL